MFCLIMLILCVLDDISEFMNDDYLLGKLKTNQNTYFFWILTYTFSLKYSME